MNMMTTIIGRPTPPIELLRALPPGPLALEYQRLKRLADLFAAFDRDDMEAGVELLMAEMDARDGDLDIEPNGDELDGSLGEDEFCEHSYTMGPGCPVADGGCPTGYAAGDPSWIEWHDRGRHKLAVGGSEAIARDRIGNALHEDAEDDDSDDVDPDVDTGGAEDEHLPAAARFYVDGPGCPLSDQPEPSLAAPEKDAGRWGGNAATGGTDDAETWVTVAFMVDQDGKRARAWA